MKQVKYKYPMIDVARLLNEWSEVEWMVMLKKCEDESDVEKLKSTLYGICRGMSELAKCKLNDEKLNVAFCNLQRSIEVTMKRILRRKYPSILDKSPKMNLNLIDELQARKELTAKRKRDLEFAQFLKDARF